MIPENSLASLWFSSYLLDNENMLFIYSLLFFSHKLIESSYPTSQDEAFILYFIWKNIKFDLLLQNVNSLIGWVKKNVVCFDFKHWMRQARNFQINFVV